MISMYPPASRDCSNSHSYLFQVDSLSSLRAIPEIIEICNEALKIDPNHVDLKELATSKSAYSKHNAQAEPICRAKGMPIDEYAWSMILIKPYLWAPKDLYTRGDDIVAWANEQLKSGSDNLEIRPSPLAPDCLGVFAKRNIMK